MAQALRRRRGRSKDSAGRSDTPGKRRPTTPMEATHSVYDRALAAAFPCPFWAVVLVGCAPVLGMVSYVFSLLGSADAAKSDDASPSLATNVSSRSQLRIMLIASMFLSVCGFCLTARVVPSIAKRMLPRVSEIGRAHV